MTTGGVSIRVDTASPVPPYEQIRTHLADLIEAGRLTDGAKLPSVRQLAADLGLANNTVVRAYRELETAGLIRSRRGSGTQVLAPSTPTGTKLKLAEYAAKYVAAARDLHATDEEALAAIRHALASPR